MNLLYIYGCITELQEKLQCTVTFGIHQFAGLQIRAFWFYKERAIHWQYTISTQELEIVNDNSAFVLYLMEKARGEYLRKIEEIEDGT